MNQDNTLSGVLSSVDMSTNTNMENLIKVGEDLLKKPVMRVDIDTGDSQPIESGFTNMEALKR